MNQARELTVETALHPKVKWMYEYWQAKRMGREMPRRSDFDPLEMRSVLGNLCLVEVTAEAPRRYLFRVDGSNLANITGFDLTGKFADQLPDPAYRDYGLALYDRVVAARAPVILVSDEDWAGVGMRVESVTMPFSTDGARVDYLLDAVFPTKHREDGG
jgi:hypothetical protein